MNQRRGQIIFGLSYGMIFSIIVIIGIIAVGFYAIKYFLGINRCSQVGLFFDDLEKEVDKAWVERYSGRFEGSLPDSGFSKLGVTHVCFGSTISPPLTAGDSDKKNVLEDYGGFGGNANVFLYPPEKACDGEYFFKSLKHAKTKDDDFFCVEVREGIASIRLEKNREDILVKISKN